jgi:hypothetical protein
MKRARLQDTLVAAEAVRGEVLCLKLPGGGRSFVAVLQVHGLAFDLRDQAGQDALLEGYRALLASLDFPIQILWQSQPLDLEPYLTTFQPADEAVDIWSLAARPLVAFLRTQAATSLLDRQIYLVLRATGLQTPAARVWAWSKDRWAALRHQPRPARAAADPLELARVQLQQRIEEVTRQLTGLGLLVRRLAGVQELAAFYARCLSPAQPPVPPGVLAACDLPFALAEDDEETLLPLAVQTLLAKDRLLQQDALPGSAGWTSLADVVSPLAVTVHPTHLQIEHDAGSEYARVLVIGGLPREVTRDWLRLLATAAQPLEVSLLIQPRYQAEVEALLRRQRVRLATSIQAGLKQSPLVDVGMEVGLEDVNRLYRRVVSREERVVEVALHILLRAPTREALDQRQQQLHLLLRSMQLQDRVARLKQRQAFEACLPHVRAQDAPGHLMQTEALARAWPFHAKTLFHPSGIVEGQTTSGELVVLDPWARELPNANRAIFGPSGKGKSYHAKVVCLRDALRHQVEQQRPGHLRTGLASQHLFLDVEQEYVLLTKALGGQVLTLGPGSRDSLNPFEPPQAARRDLLTHWDAQREALEEHVAQLLTLFELMVTGSQEGPMRVLLTEERALLERATFEAYHQAYLRAGVAGVPTLRDLYELLKAGTCGPDDTHLHLRLDPYVQGAWRSLFAGQTNVRLNAALVDFDLHLVDKDLLPVVAWLITHYAWQQAADSLIPRVLVIDEAKSLHAYPAGRRFIEQVTSRSRKRRFAVWVMSQYVPDFQDSPVLTNCAIKFLTGQDTSALETVQAMFALSKQEVGLLGQMTTGQGLLLAHTHHLPLTLSATPLEHVLANTDPTERAEWMTAPRFAPLRRAIDGILASNGEAEAARAMQTLLQVIADLGIRSVA